MKFYRSLCCVFLGLLVITTIVTSQEQKNATIAGTVTDSTGAAIPNVQIKILPNCKCSDCKNPDKCDCCPDQVTINSNSQGRFKLRVEPGTYTVKVRDQELKVTINPNEDRSVHITVK